MDRMILHADGNCFYASCEMQSNPALRDVPLVVGGDQEARHGIVLAKNDIAKKFKIQTGEALVVAKQKCPGLVIVPARYDLYIKISQQLREIYLNYTDQVEAFGLDECWLDVTHSQHLFGDGEYIANKIRRRIKEELGITVSVGVSYNKIFAKLGSDMKKPDATTVITRENYRQKVWPLPVEDLLYVGAATKTKMHKIHVRTVGQLAQTNPDILKGLFGKWGYVLWIFANGEDPAVVTTSEAKPVIKSVGNSTTTPHDVKTDNDVKITLYLMAESVAARLREYGYFARTAQISIRGNDLSWYERQAALPYPCQDSNELFKVSYALYQKNKSRVPIRSIGVRACNLLKDELSQLSFLPDIYIIQKHEQVERALDGIRDRFGFYSVRRGIMMTNTRLSGINPKDEHVIFPVSYFK